MLSQAMQSVVFNRRVMTQKKPQDVRPQDFAEELIQQAYANGDFNHLPGIGQPIADIDEPYEEDWWIKQKLRREKISVLPPSLEILRDVEQTLAGALKLGSEQAVRQEIESLNDRIREANFRSVWGPPSTQLPVEVDAFVARWRAHRSSST